MVRGSSGETKMIQGVHCAHAMAVAQLPARSVTIAESLTMAFTTIFRPVHHARHRFKVPDPINCPAGRKEVVGACFLAVGQRERQGGLIRRLRHKGLPWFLARRLSFPLPAYQSERDFLSSSRPYDVAAVTVPPCTTVDLKAVQGETVARRRIAYDELLASQIALALVRRQQKKAAGRATAGDGALRRRIEATPPFTLTDGQKQALADIHDDMEKPERMLRLLQGDVGSGKTVVSGVNGRSKAKS